MTRAGKTFPLRAIIAVAVSPCISISGAAQGLRCSEHAPASPRVLTSVPSQLLHPRIVAGGARIFVVGVEQSASSKRDGAGLKQSLLALRVYRLDRREFEPARLTGHFVFGYPMAALDRAGVLHVIWGEPDTSDHRDLSYRTLWHATYAKGKWSTPVPIYHAARILWGPIWTSDLVSDTDGDLAVAFTADPAPDRAQVLSYLTWHDGAWSVRELSPATEGEMYVDMATNDAKHVTIVYVVPSPAADDIHRTSNALFAVRSNDGGETWSTPAPVSRVDQGLAYKPRVVVDGRGTTHVIWVAGNGTGLDTRAVMHATSVDGLRWRDAAPVSMSGIMVEYSAFVDQCNTVHEIVVRLGDGGLGLVHLRFPAVGGGTVEPLLANWNAHEMSLATDADRVRFVWIGRARPKVRAAATRHETLGHQTLYSEFAIQTVGSKAAHP